MLLGICHELFLGVVELEIVLVYVRVSVYVVGRVIRTLCARTRDDYDRRVVVHFEIAVRARKRAVCNRFIRVAGKFDFAALGHLFHIVTALSVVRAERARLSRHGYGVYGKVSVADTGVSRNARRLQTVEYVGLLACDDAVLAWRSLSARSAAAVCEAVCLSAEYGHLSLFFRKRKRTVLILQKNKALRRNFEVQILTGLNCVLE